MTQNAKLEAYLRGTGRSITFGQAEAIFRVKNLRARMSEFRQAGLRVLTSKTKSGKTAYSVSRRHVVTGNKVKLFS